MAARSKPSRLSTYRAKRRFVRTPEPAGRSRGPSRDGSLSFVVQRHAARRLHYDFRLEWAGVLKSWAVPKGPSMDPRDKRLAVQVEDHPVEYGRFSGTIPQGEYGAGTVEIWDSGRWIPEGDVERGLRVGKLKFELVGKRLFGTWALVRLKSADAAKPQWLLMRSRGSGEAKPVAVSSAAPAHADDASRKRPRQSFIAPQLATAVSDPPAGGQWFSELKLDGYRMLAHVDHDRVACHSRNGREWTRRLPAIAADLRELELGDAVVDGELVAVDAQGRATFQLLQRTLDGGDDSSLLYYVFDLLRIDGHDCRPWPLADRKVQLHRTLAGVETSRHIRLLEYSPGISQTVLARICAERMEGLILKDVKSRYTSGRSRTWLKLKCRREQEFVIGGYTRAQGGRETLTSLLLGQYDAEGILRHVGRVGTGFTDSMLRKLRTRLDALARSHSPFEPAPPTRAGERNIWSKPGLVAQVRFASWTDQGLLRQPLFLGLRDDRSARSVKKEPEVIARVRNKRKSVDDASLTHADRVVFPEGSITKGELASYYQGIEGSLWPHIVRRPLSLLRATENGQVFLQRHLVANASMPGLRELAAPVQGDAPYIAAASKTALRTFGQFTCIELHTWGSRDRRPDRADRLTFDLDPDPSLSWARVRDASRLVHELLDHLELDSFLKTTGGQGLHVVVPLSPPLPAWSEAAEFCRLVANHFARTFPELFSARSGARNRQSRIYIDHLRNRLAATTVAAYSPRFRAGAPVSMPIGWHDLGNVDLRGSHFNLRNAISHATSRRTDPWKQYPLQRQRLLKRHVLALQRL